ncbi:Ribonuclease H-like superfamily protein [Gossypium australe]|uniref:Ribonuclease H-like superfamily protein n=1 Tax=Gossypium australe TaxID=47621 RepID=A0A5B6V6Y6_9ROSI|nr:Ribonuclease H-like superfamily protein [Gossypium australe]
MGFRDINSFNVALLAKQGWSLLRNPNSLLARTLKARYFKDSDFLKSNLGRLPSLTWRSVWESKGLLLKGLGWRIGDGQQVSIWEDNWVPEINVLNDQFRETNQNIVKVADLIDCNTRKWKSDLILHTFVEREAESIICIPLPMRHFADFVVWSGEPTGEYSVRSGHKALTHDGQTQVHDRFKQFYKRLWNLDLPLKIKITVWRIACNFLPNYSNLYYRRLRGSAICRMCQIEAETREHLFKVCPVAKEIWEKLEIVWPILEENMEFPEMLCRFFAENSLGICRKFVCALWGIWTARNKFMHEWDMRTAEALACYQALVLGVHLGIRDVDVEGDSRAVIQKLQGESMDRSEIAAYIADSKKLLSHFRSCVFIFQNREANDAAYNIASEGIIRGENAYLSHLVSEGGVDLMMAERR